VFPGQGQPIAVVWFPGEFLRLCFEFEANSIKKLPPLSLLPVDKSAKYWKLFNVQVIYYKLKNNQLNKNWK